MACAIDNDASFLSDLFHCVNQESHAEEQHIEPQAIDAAIPIKQIIEQTTELLKDKKLLGPALARQITEKISNLRQRQWSSFLVPRHHSTNQLPLSSRNVCSCAWEGAWQLQKQFESLPKMDRGVQPFYQFMQFDQHLQETCLSIKELTRCIQTSKLMSPYTRQQLMGHIVHQAKQWIFRISTHYREITNNRWNVFIMFNTTTNLPEVHLALAPQRFLSMRSTPNQIMYILSVLYLIMQSGCNPNPEDFIPSENMMREFIAAYPQSHNVRFPRKNPFEIHAPIVNCMYILIFSYIHNVGIELGLTYCDLMLSKWKGRIIQYINPLVKNCQHNYTPALRDLFMFIRCDKTLPIPPWFFNSKQRSFLITNFYNLILKNASALTMNYARKKMHNDHFINNAIKLHQQNYHRTSLDKDSMQLIDKLNKDEQKVTKKQTAYTNSDLKPHDIHMIRAAYEAMLVEENFYHKSKDAALCHYTSQSSSDVKQQLYSEHFHHTVIDCMQFATMFDLHSWNMQSAQNTTPEMHVHNKQQLDHFRNNTSKYIILGFHNTKTDCVRFQRDIYEKYEKAQYPVYIMNMNGTFKTFSQILISNNTTQKILSLNSRMEECLCNLKLLLDTIDPQKKILTAEFLDNFFSADHYTYSTFDSWYPSKEQHTCQQCLVECPV